VRVTSAPADELRASQLLAATPANCGTNTATNTGATTSSSSSSPGDNGSGGGGGAGSRADGAPEGAGVAPTVAKSKVHQQLELLGEMHVGYRERRVGPQRVTIVGGRPFSKVRLVFGGGREGVMYGGWVGG